MIDPEFKTFLHYSITQNSQGLIQYWLNFFEESEQEVQHRYYADFLSFFAECVAENLEFNNDSYYALFSFMTRLSELIGEELFYDFRNSVFTCYLKFPILNAMEEKGVFTFRNVATLTAFFESLTSRLMLEYMEQRRKIEETTARELKEREAPMNVVGTRTLMVSIVGTLDSHRVMAIIDRVLTKIEEGYVRHVIIDINAILDMNTEVANQLVKLNKAIRFMGAYSYLAGITKNVAKSLMHLDINLGDIRTYNSTKDALRDINKLVDKE